MGLNIVWWPFTSFIEFFFITWTVGLWNALLSVINSTIPDVIKFLLVIFLMIIMFVLWAFTAYLSFFILIGLFIFSLVLWVGGFIIDLIFGFGWLSAIKILGICYAT